MKALIWNVRGLSSSCRRLRKLIRHHNLGLIALIEPFLQSNKLSAYAAKLRFSNFISSSNNKICLLWSSDFIISNASSNSQFEVFQAEFIPWDTKFHLVIIYAKHSRTERQQLWVDLATSLQTIDGPVIVGGDFNTIACTEEYRGGGLSELE